MSSESSHVLGIDLGVTSVGAALIDPQAKQILWSGVRIFSAAFEGDYESGKEESRARQRRLARQQRRQTDRRRRRMLKVYRLLQQWGLLPCGERTQVLPALDAELRKQYPDTEILPYTLRARAVEQPLSVYELGRAFYHLAQRRGFRGRAARDADGDEGGQLKAKMEGLWAEIRQSGCRTLGQYLSTLDPHISRIRDRRTHRRMYEEEFEAIWDFQAPHHPEILTPERRAVLHSALFYQRPLKPTDHLVGQCELEPGEKRAPLWLLEAQQYRVLGAINNLRLVLKDGSTRQLDDRERRVLMEESLRREKLSFKEIRKLLALADNCKFSIEIGGETGIPGNATSHRIYRILGDEWLQMPAERQRELVADLADPKRNETDEDLLKCLTTKWRFPCDTAQALSEVNLPDGYVRLSLKAIQKVMPHLEAGMTFSEARRLLWPEHFTEKEPLPYLPPVLDVLSEVRNPVVIRALTELRKVVNAVIRRYGKPASIHIELARDMKRSREERLKESRKNREREKLRERAKNELKPYVGDNPSRADIEKYLLWLECKGRCPYTGQSISLQSLFGEYPRFDVEHIIPFERSLDDSFQNKTLCEASFNKTTKGKRTPFEASGHSSEWPEMVARVREFGNPGKLKRFTMTETDTEKLLAEFTQRQLNDTRYASRLAAKYLGCLYGIDRSDNRRIVVCAGQVTAYLRQKWDLNRVLHDRPEKNREDHRHHAVDAIAIALASPAQVRCLADAASRALAEGHRRFGSLADPWPDFRQHVKEAVSRVQVSYRPKRRLKGALHEETYYSAPITVDGKKYIRTRKPVDQLTAAEINQIADPKVRTIVKSAWEAVGRDAKKLRGQWPCLETKDGRRIPIKRVRYYKREEAHRLGNKDASPRYVIAKGNHHIEVLAVRDILTNKIKKWEHCTVSSLEAAERYRQRVPIVQKDHGPGREFLFSLAEGDLVMARRSEGSPEDVWYVRSVRARGAFELQPSTDARKKQDVIESGKLWDVQLNTLMKLGGRKVVVTPLGEILEAHD